MVLRVSFSAERAVFSAVQGAFERLAGVSQRLATLQRIRRGSDDPAGLIAATRLATELAVHQRALEVAERSRATLSVADSALGHAAGLLTQLDGTLVAAADESLSPAVRDALQLEIDSTLDALGRLGKISFGGRAIFGSTFTFSLASHPAAATTLTFPDLDDSLGGDSGVLAALRSGGAASLASGNLASAASIVSEARSNVLSLRAQTGAVERAVIDSTQNFFRDSQANLARALSAVGDANVAQEASYLVRESILADMSIRTSSLLLRQRWTAVELLHALWRR